ncbi:MAG: site-specific integrase [Gallionella sp.]|nr:site-specific integrase [Gallionella sp.]
MLFTLPCRTDVLVDEFGLPRYWAAVWAMFHGGRLAPSTLHERLRQIDKLYQHTERIGGILDDALCELDFEVLSAALESYFIGLCNIPRPTKTAQTYWHTAFDFVRDTCERIERNPAVGNRMADIRERMGRLDRLYLGLRPFRKRLGAQLRAIPRMVVLEMLDAVTPGSPTNPFKQTATQWRAYSLVTLLLFQGVRRGEMLSLRADFLKSERDPRTGAMRWRMSVRTNEAEDDTRKSLPSIKTAQSIRTIPVTPQTAEGLLVYSENYRGKVDHPYFLSSMRDLPLSLEGVSKLLQKLSTALSPAARVELLDLTEAKYLTAHALRHTCAVVRMKQLLANGQTTEQAMAQLRSFFGWSKTSVMPLHYAKAALDERLNETWNDKLDDRLELFRNLPR